ncbi:coiled-coil domain-containing protein 81-like isoform 1-T1 [Spheniscus humboldti]
MAAQGYKRGHRTLGPAPWRSVHRMNAGMSSHRAVATKEQPSSMRRTKMDFWDGMEHAFMMPSITAKERNAVWDAVAGYVQEQLLLQKGVRIPTLGSFDVVPTRIQVGNEIVIIQRPVLRLARNLGGVHNLMDNKDDLPGDKELEPLKYAKVATDASVSRRKAEGCILGITSLLSQCLGKGENVALVLRDVGVLLIEGRRVQMKFYSDFLERITGKRIQEGATFKVPQLLDMVVSRMVPVASLTLTGRVIIFPEFELEFVPKSPPRDPLKTLRNVPGEDKWKQKEVLPPVRQGK